MYAIEFNVMDYKSLGFKCGLECHQQLETKKLFCDCPSLVNDPNEPDVILKRRLRASMGELGEIDEAAKFEQSKNKEFIYEACSSSSCLVEYDEEPIKSINKEALEAALELALLLNMNVIEEVHVMRKVVVDGSNVSGFQRTMLIAVDGYIETSKGKVGIATLCLEEEAAKKIKSTENIVTYRLDRLGVPLLEIATTPEIKDGEHAKEVASTLGMILRSTGRVKRGIGTIRQDINLSIDKLPRVELKGFQDLRNIPKVIENEINRQLKEGQKRGEVRKVEQNGNTTFLRPMPGANRMYVETDHPIIEISNGMLSKIVLPELITEKILNVEKKFCLRHEIAQEVVEREIDLGSLSKVYKNIEPRIIADILIEIPKEIKSRFKIDSEIKKGFMDKVLDNLNKGNISKDSVIEILVDHCNGKEVNFNDYRKVSDKEIENEIKKIINNKKDLSPNAVMGIIMSKYKGKVEGKKVFELINKFKS